ncbi:MAG: RNA polymerase sigma factor [Chloroflexi bacterium]|nr:RNA polymerase sigma factor [Chloroflexota bacterium]
MQSGEADAFQRLQAELEPQIRRFVRRILGDSRAEDDVLQDMFVALYNNLDRIQPIENLRPYLYGIARNRCYSELRRERRYERVSLDDEPDFEFDESAVYLADDAGSFIVVWENEPAGSGDPMIDAQHYSADGTPLVNQFQVNTLSGRNGGTTRLDMNAAGAFVAVWTSTLFDIRAQRYDSNGMPHRH